MFKCVVCKQRFNDGQQARQSACAPGSGGHMLQEEMNGDPIRDIVTDTPTGERADFIAPSAKELREWAEKAKKFGYSID